MMADKVKLTQPQKTLLYSIIENGASYVYESYQPAKKLVEVGYARWVGDNLKATGAGKRAYREETKK